MTENLTKSLINLRDFGLAPQAVAKLCLDHAERRFNVASFVVLLEKPFLVVAIVVKKSAPKGGLAIPVTLYSVLPPCPFSRSRPAIALERNVRHGVMVYHGLQARRRQVRLISGDFGHREVLRSRINQRLEVFNVSREAIGNLNCRNNVGFNAAHQMDFHPTALVHQLSVFVLGIYPLIKAGSREARGIYSKIRLNRLQGLTAFLNERLEQRRQASVFQIARDGIVVRGLRQMALSLRIAQVRHKAATGKTGVNLKRAGEDNVSKRQPGAAHFLLRLFYSLAQLSKQLNKLFLFRNSALCCSCSMLDGRSS